jgi:hypothetical protein
MKHKQIQDTAMKSPVIVISLTVVAVVTIAASVYLVATGHDIETLLRTLTTGVSLLTVASGLFAVQAKQGAVINKVAGSVNGNTTTLINAAIASAALAPEVIAQLTATNTDLINPTTPSQ